MLFIFNVENKINFVIFLTATKLEFQFLESIQGSNFYQVEFVLGREGKIHLKERNLIKDNCCFFF